MSSWFGKMFSSGDSVEFDEKLFRKEVLNAHNHFRALHGTPALTVDSTVEKEAQKWAEHLASKGGALEHQHPSKYGENLYKSSSTHLSSPEDLAKATVQKMYDESKQYNYNRFNASGYSSTGHFTQLVWKSSRKIGVGVCVRKNESSDMCYTVLVCVKYDPAGNLNTKEAFAENVPPPRR